ncbi:MAG: ATP-binding cassette domain-containing protein [Deltaproteobacteria bacterium]|nr:ATP-binding cassette domain-containing protein [Deltaproteobacteria bacterium]
MSNTAVCIENLRKSYGPIVALDSISLEVERGKIFGLLGPNGAGKTTAVKILTTLVRPDGGKVEVAGTDVLRDPVKVRSLIGYVPQELTVDPYLTAREHLRYYADLYHLSAAAQGARIRELVTLVGLAGHEDRRVRQFSGGMKKKIDLACGFIHRPPLIFLDEPSLGLDVQVRRDVWSYILRLKEQGTTVFLCTNYMDEAERLCDDVAIIDGGRIAVMGTPAALRSQLKRDVVSVEIASPNEHHQERLEALEKAVSQLAMVHAIVKDGTQLKVYVESNETALPQILQTATTLAISIHTATYSRPGLDDVFLHYTGRPFTKGEERRE